MNKCNHDYEIGRPKFIHDNIKIEAECIYCGKIILFDFINSFTEKVKSTLDKKEYS